MGQAGPIAPKQHLVILKWEGPYRAIVCGTVGKRHDRERAPYCLVICEEVKEVSCPKPV